ncbi:MAG: hypothetical protein ACOCVU_00605 [Desulfohalobiaceae bacterium]
MRAFSILLQGGVQCRVMVPAPLPELLTTGLAIAPHYVEQELQTLFLNGRPVDSMEHTVVCNGDVLALSAALPGLVGATMRRDGQYAALREGIKACPAAGHPTAPQRGVVTVKLFNTTARDLSSTLLHRGILIPADRLSAFLAGQDGSFWKLVQRIVVDGQPVPAEPEPIQAMLEGSQPIFLVLPEMEATL